MSTQRRLQIGEVAEAVDLSIRTIRHYDELGVVVPSGRSSGGFRLYTEADVTRLLFVRKLKPLGFTLDEVQELITLRDGALEGRLDDSGMTKLDAFASMAEERCKGLRAQLKEAEIVATDLRTALGQVQGTVD